MSTTTPIPQHILERYIKVRSLALEGVDGEQVNAQRMLKKMQEKYDNIEEEADFWYRINNEHVVFEDEESSSEEQPHWSDVWREQQNRKRNNDWKNKFDQWTQTATSAFSWAANVASQAFGIQDARNLANSQSYTHISIRQNPSGSQTMNIRLDEETLEYLDSLNDEQRATYCNAVAQRVAIELYQSLIS